MVAACPLDSPSTELTAAAAAATIPLHPKEGCFTASFYFDSDSTWGVVPQCEFNITQSTLDKLLLMAINAFFNFVGTVHDKVNGVSVLTFRSMHVLTSVIIPFFLQYPLLTLKGAQFDIWCQIVSILSAKYHVGKTLVARDNLLLVARLMRELNSARENTRKARRSAVIIKWLESLTDVPTRATPKPSTTCFRTFPETVVN